MEGNYEDSVYYITSIAAVKRKLPPGYELGTCRSATVNSLFHWATLLTQKKIMMKKKMFIFNMV